MIWKTTSEFEQTMCSASGLKANCPRIRLPQNWMSWIGQSLRPQQEDPFFSYTDLAEQWGVTAATVRNRIKRLKINGVIDVVMVINPYKIGYETFAMIGIKLQANASPLHLIERLQSTLGVAGITMVAGNYDLFVVYVCRNLEEYRQFINDELRSIKEIASFESFIGLDLFERKFLVGVVS